jgi:DNA-binding NarL/FixJ family response regulator
VRSLLSCYRDIEVVGEAASAAALFALVADTRPQVILLDIRMPGQNGVETAARLKRDWPDIKVIVLSTYDDDEYLFGAIRAGADGYLLKSASPEVLADAIRQTHAGERLLGTGLVDKVLRGFQQLAQDKTRAESGLSDQELEVLRLVAGGATNKEIAEKLYWSEATVKRKVQDILEKLGVANRPQAVAEAARRGLL